jgi:hypothetical protein
MSEVVAAEKPKIDLYTLRLPCVYAKISRERKTQ